MYTSFFGFKKDPFNLKLDLDFFYQAASWTSLYEWFSGQILARRGVLMLIGTEGVGKTLLLFQIVSRLQHRAKFVYFHAVSDSYEEFIDNLCDELGLDVTGKLMIDKLSQLNDYLKSDKHTRIAVVIDDAQKLNDTILHDILLTLTPPTTHRASIQVILSGLPELEEKYNQLKRKSLALESEKIFLYKLKRLDSKGVSEYIHQRLNAVGCTDTDLFTQGALSKIASYSKGVPLLVNNLCSLALERASEQEVHTVSRELMDTVSRNYFAENVTARTEQSKAFEVWFTDKVGPLFKGLSERFASATEFCGGLVAEHKVRYAAIGLVVASVLLIPYLIIRAKSPDDLVGSGQVAVVDTGRQSIRDIEAEASIQDAGKALTAKDSDIASFESGSDNIVDNSTDISPSVAVYNDADAARLFIKELESAGSEVNLDAVYEKAESMNAEQKLNGAYLLYFYAAKQGHANAAFRLGQFADPETFDPKRSLLDAPNASQAYKWYQSAFIAGHPQAKQSLGRLRSEVEKLAASGDERAYQLSLQWQ